MTGTKKAELMRTIVIVSFSFNFVLHALKTLLKLRSSSIGPASPGEPASPGKASHMVASDSSRVQQLRPTRVGPSHS